MGTSNKKPGRPGRPKKMINDKETLDKITELGALGLTFGQIARCLGISRSSLDRRRAEFEEIEEAIKKGESLGIAKVASALVDSAVIDKNPTSMIFYLKNRSENWADHQQTNINLDLGGILTDARQRIIDSTSERLGVPGDAPGELTHERTEKLEIPRRAYERSRDTEK